ncbi:hypothetical protein Q7P37_010743 [Cladosporium fusiforme]
MAPRNNTYPRGTHTYCHRKTHISHYDFTEENLEAGSLQVHLQQADETQRLGHLEHHFQAVSAHQPLLHTSTDIRDDYDRSAKMNAVKRKPSRSPDGSAAQRKVSRGMSPTKSNYINPGADPRRQKNILRSPGSTDSSVYQDVTSSRSSPQPSARPQTAPMAFMKSVTNGQVSHDEDSSSSLHESLKSLVSELALQASLQNSLGVAKAMLDKYQVDYTSMAHQFTNFPPIKERLTKMRDGAKEEFEKLERQVREKEAAQESLTSNLEQAILDVPSRAHLGTVPREDFDKLQRSHEILERSHKTLEDRFDKQQEHCSKQAKAIDEFREALKSITKDVSDTKKFRAESSGSLQAIDKRTTALEGRATTNEAGIQGLRPSVEDHKRAITELKTSLAKNKIELIAKDDTIKSLGLRVDEVDSTITGVEGRVTAKVDVCKDDLEKIRSAITEAGKESVVTRLRRQDQLINNIWTKIENISKAPTPPTPTCAQENIAAQVDGYKKELEQVRSQIAEDGKESVMNRLKEQDAVINNVRKIVEDISNVPTAPNPAQLSGLEERLSGLDKEVRALKETTAVGQDKDMLSESDMMAPASQTYVTEQLIRLESTFDDKSDETCKMISDHASSQVEEVRQELLKLLSDRIEKLSKSQAHCEDSRQLDMKENTNTTARTHAQLASLAKSFEGLQSQVTAFSDTVRALQNRPSIPAVPTPPPPAQFRPTSLPGTPTLPQINGISSPSNANLVGRPNRQPSYPMQSPVGAPTSQDIASLRSDLTGTVAHVHHLRQRMDNLTTEELVERMIEQVKRLPDYVNFQAVANTFQAAIDTLQTRGNTTNDRLSSLSQSVKTLHVDLHNLKTQLSTIDLSTVQTLRTSVQNMESTIRQLPNDVKSQTQVAIETAKVEVAKDVDAQTNHLTKLTKQFTAHEGAIVKLNGRVSLHEEACNKLTGQFKTLSEGVADLSGAVAGLNEVAFPGAEEDAG